MCDKCKGKFYITTPIYYPSDKLHIGHTYCTVATDAMARYKGSRATTCASSRVPTSTARRLRPGPRKPASRPRSLWTTLWRGEKGVKDLWKLMDISYDRFIRTTDSYHVSAIQKNLQGDVRKGRYLQGHL